MRPESNTIADELPIWPAWLFSAVIHAAGLTAAALTGAQLFRGSDAEQGQPIAWELQLGPTADELSVPADELPAETPAFDMAAADPAATVPAATVPAATATRPELLPPVSDAEPTPVAPPRPSVLGLDALLAQPPAAAAPAGAGGSGVRGERFRVGQLGGRATVQVFGVEGVGSKFVYVFDHSVSMTGAPLAAAQEQLIRSLDALDRVHQFHVLFFNHRVSVWAGADGGGRIAFATRRNKQLATQFVRRMTASGTTYRIDALKQALDMAPDVIFFLTDADDTMPASEVLDAIERASRTGTTIACIEFGLGAASGRDNFLKDLARGAGGQYGYVDVGRLPR